MTLFFNGVSCSSRLYLFKKYRKKQWYCEILLQFLILVSILIHILKNIIYSCEAKLYFQHHFSSLQCHMNFRNHNNMLNYYQCCWSNMLIYSETVVLLNIFWNLLLFSLINKKLKEHLFKIEIFSNNISLYYKCYPCNTSLLNKVSLTFFKLFYSIFKKKEKNSDPKLLNSVYCNTKSPFWINTVLFNFLFVKNITGPKKY